ncbi:selenoprotein H isoform X2 [Brachyhypopomus gauderio]|uniref:selenoprotein H isoform X2 n=1 Tax=Brachyhypopomus gauderio TaxID=698409 RepID=UPI004041E53B
MSLEPFQTFQQELSAILETLLATAFRDITQLVKYSLLHDVVHVREETQALTQRLQDAGGQRSGGRECREDRDEKKEELLFIVKQDPEAESEGDKTEEEDGLELETSLLRNYKAVVQLPNIGVEHVNAEAEKDKQRFHGESPPAQSSESLLVRQSCQWACNILTGNNKGGSESAAVTSRVSDHLQRWDVQPACMASVNKEEDPGPLGTDGGGSGQVLPFGVDIVDNVGNAPGRLGQTPASHKATRTPERDSSEFPNTSAREMGRATRGVSPRLSFLPFTSNCAPPPPCGAPKTSNGKSGLNAGLSPNSMLARESTLQKINRDCIVKGHSSMGHASEVTFSQKGHVVVPVNAGEVKKKLHECTHCGKTFLLKRNLLYHQRYHMAERAHTCTECGKGFVYRCHLNAHMRSHSGERAYNCTECGKSFIYLWNLKKHMTIHLGLRPYCCSTCNKSFIWKSDLKKHKQIHTKKTI